MSDPIFITQNDQEIMDGLRELVSRVEDMTPVMRRISGIMLDCVEENFEQEGRPDPWPKLKKRTIKERERKGYWPGKILQQRGELAASLASDYDKESAKVTTNKAYAAAQNFGTGNNPIKIPARKGVARLRTDRYGVLLRQGESGRLLNLSVFAKAHHKRVVERDYTAKAHEISLPPRPFMVLTVDAKEEINDSVKRYLILSQGDNFR
ncbi:MAG: phage virion morphogenesis protein [Fibrobacter sp.]|nr:phage virion morphogenesis protein [Fibrobacter sp.]